VTNVLFVCVQNAGRSQMAQALYEWRGGQARSAGTAPAERVHPEVAEAMGELGIEVSSRIPRKLSRDDVEWAEVVVTMGCGDQCPYIPGKQYMDWDLADPAGQSADEVRAVRDEIERRVAELPL
jgi:arsenate reductase